MAGVIALVYFGYKQNGPYTFSTDTLETLLLIFALLGFVYYLKTTTYLEIQDGRMLINSGYRTFGKDLMDIRDIKYVYRYPEFILKWYGSRMVFYIKDASGKLCRSSVREVNYSNETIIEFLKRLKEIKSSTELDKEYQLILEGRWDTDYSSNNTVESVEARLKEKGESWE